MAAKSITFRGSKMTGYHGVPKEGVTLIRVKIESDYTEQVRSEVGLDWPELPVGIDSMKPEGSLVGGENFILTPGDGLKNNEIDVSFVTASKFEVVRVNIPKKDSTNDVIRFELLCTAIGSGALIATYMETVGDVLGVLKIRYAESQKLDNSSEDPAQTSLLAVVPVRVPKPRSTVKA